MSSAGWRGGTRPSGVSGRKVGQGESRPRAQRLRRLKKQSSQLTAALRARPSAKALPILSRLVLPGVLGPAPISGPGLQLLGTAAIMAPALRSSGAFPQMALFFFHRLVTTFASTENPGLGGLSLRSAPMAHERTAQLSASPPMFESRFLDFFSRVHPAIPAIIFVPIVVGGVWLGIDRGLAVGTTVLLFVARARHLDADRVLAPPPALPLGAEVPRRRPPPLHHPRRPPRPSERRDAAGHAPRRQRPPRRPLPRALRARLRDAARLPRLLRLHPRLPDLRLHALPPAPSRAEDEVREEAAHPPHAPPLPGPPLRLRRLLAALGRDHGNAAAKSEDRGDDTGEPGSSS